MNRDERRGRDANRTGKPFSRSENIDWQLGWLNDQDDAKLDKLTSRLMEEKMPQEHELETRRIQTVGPREFAVRLALTEAMRLMSQSRQYLFPWRGPSEGQMVERINDHLIAIGDALGMELDVEEESR